MIYVITFKELYDRSWLPIKTRATTDEKKAIQAYKEWCDQGSCYWAEIKEVEAL